MLEIVRQRLVRKRQCPVCRRICSERGTSRRAMRIACGVATEVGANNPSYPLEQMT
jgi:hypothetical protein